MTTLEERPPRWARRLVGAAADAAVDPADHRIEATEGEHFSLVSGAVPCPAEISADQLEALARDLYLSILERAATLATAHLARVWNFIPRILDPLDQLPHGYMAFNAGRFRAYRHFFGDAFPERMPTASGVGTPHPRLVVHALGASVAAAPIDNPRQFPSHRYSRRYGPLPPCFARAVELPLPDGRRWLLAGGTASVRGERTVHSSELAAQTDETLLNLATLIDAADGRTAPRGSAEREAPPPAGWLAERLDRYRYLRVYLPDPRSLDPIAGRLLSTFGHSDEIEIFGTELCRPDLLIEIEGAAELAPRPRRSTAG